ncbi:MAG: 5'/3'-nucleotidase SurE [Verrucomicrobiota bacterium]|jgi:5'-nucleotidase|nr:5'/3'-nucleotidase SurE [Verrucomicrobiota bacterium]
MKILLCNDDGIQALGIHTLQAAVHDLGDVHVVAPDGERSAIGHGITLTKPLYTRSWPNPNEMFGIAVSGTPADCVKLSVNSLFKPAPDLVLSGINLGPNAGISVLYSGTVSAATESVIMGIPAIAFSLDTFVNPQWETASRVSRRIVEQVVSGRLTIAPELFWNVNIPNLPYEQLKGIRITKLGSSRFVEQYERRLDPWGNPYYWMRGDLLEMGDMQGSDLEALREGYVSLSPVGLDRTSHASLEALAVHPPELA